MARYKQNRWKSGGNKRVAFRTGSRRAKSYGPFFFGAQSLGPNTVRSINTLLAMSPSAKLARAIEKERKKVVKRMAELIAEGYDFDFDEFRDIWTGNVKHSHKQLERLQKMSKRNLRRYASSYKGVTDKLLMEQMFNAEVQEKKRRNKLKKEAKKEADRQRRQAEQDAILQAEREKDRRLLDQIPRDLDIKIQNLISDEEKYLEACDRWMETHYATKKQWDRYYMAVNLANACIEELQNADDNTKAKIIEFVEKEGELGGKIEDDWYVLFYRIPDEYNEPLLNLSLFPMSQETADAISDLKAVEDPGEFVDLSNVRPSSFEDDDFLPQ